MRDVAVVSFAQSERPRGADPQRGRDAHAGRRTRRSSARASGARRSASPARAVCDYLAGAPFAFVIGPRRGGRVAADPRVARRDGRRVGAVRGVGAAAARRPRLRARLRVRQVVARRPADVLVPQTRPVLPRAAVARPVELAALQARAWLDAGHDRARHGRGRGPQPARRRWTTRSAQVQGDDAVDDLLREPYLVVAAAQARLPADLRRRRADRARRRRPGARRVRAARRGSAASTTASRRTPSACATSRTSPSTQAAGEKAGVNGRRRRRAARAVQPPGADPARRARPRRRRRASTRRAARSPPTSMMAAGLTRIGEAAQRIIDGERRPGRRPRHVGPVPAAEPRLRAGGRRMSELLRGRRHRPDQAQVGPHRRLDRRARARGGAARPRRRRDDAGRTSTPS